MALHELLKLLFPNGYNGPGGRVAVVFRIIQRPAVQAKNHESVIFIRL